MRNTVGLSSSVSILAWKHTSSSSSRISFGGSSTPGQLGKNGGWSHRPWRIECKSRGYTRAADLCCLATLMPIEIAAVTPDALQVRVTCSHDQHALYCLPLPNAAGTRRGTEKDDYDARSRRSIAPEAVLTHKEVDQAGLCANPAATSDSPPFILFLDAALLP